MATQANKRSNKKKANEKKANIFVLFAKKCFRSGGDENERQMATNVNFNEMRFVIRNLIDVDDVSPATALVILPDCLYLRWYFREVERMMQHIKGKYFPSL